jgi:hypothetical protein
MKVGPKIQMDGEADSGGGVMPKGTEAYKRRN